jgi:hypothetical protein
MSGTWAAGWAVGDIVTAAEYKKGVGAIYNTVLGAPAASVDITGIPASYAHLTLEFQARGDTVALSTNVLLRFNNDTAANYDHEWFQGSGSGGTVTTAENLAQTSIFLGSVPAASAAADIFSGGHVEIPSYAGAIGQKSLTAQNGAKVGTSTGNLTNYLVSGYWRSTVAVSRITVFPSAGSFIAGSRFTLYVKGA